MHIVKRKEYDYEGYGSRWKEIAYFGGYHYLPDVKRDLDAINKLVDIDFKDLSNEEFHSLINNFYYLQLTKKDLIGLLSKINGIEYTKFEKLNSRMTYKDIVREGHGRDFSWWEETYQISWLVLSSKDLDIDSNRSYSKEEIQEMIDKKQIVSFGRFDKAIGFDPVIPFEKEQVEKVNIPFVSIDYDRLEGFVWDYDNCFLLDRLNKDDSELSQKVYKEAISLVRKRLNKKKVLNDCKQIILFLNDNIDVVCNVVKNGLYMDEETENQYLSLASELTESHKHLALRFGKSKK